MIEFDKKIKKIHKSICILKKVVYSNVVNTKGCSQKQELKTKKGEKNNGKDDGKDN